MGKVVSLARERARIKQSRQQSSLCREGHHSWEVDKEKRFDVKRGGLVTRYRCRRCGKERVVTQ